jgi:hypothetical protein
METPNASRAAYAIYHQFAVDNGYKALPFSEWSRWMAKPGIPPATVAETTARRLLDLRTNIDTMLLRMETQNV